MQLFWKVLGFVSLGLAYIGVVTPGIPFSIFIVFSAYCFSKGSPAMHKWLYNHKTFGPFLANWVHCRVFPTKMKWLMLLTMASSLGIIWFTTHDVSALAGSGIFMILVAIWAWRYPGSLDEWEDRVINNKRIGWIK